MFFNESKIRSVKLIVITNPDGSTRIIDLEMFDKPISDYTVEEGFKALGINPDGVSEESVCQEIQEFYHQKTNAMAYFQRIINSKATFPDTYSWWFKHQFSEQRQVYVLNSVFQAKKRGSLTPAKVKYLKNHLKTSWWKPLWLFTNTFREDFELAKIEQERTHKNKSNKYKILTQNALCKLQKSLPE